MNSKSIKSKLGIIIDLDNIIPASILAIIILGTELRTHPLLIAIICLLYAVYRSSKIVHL